MTKKTMEENRKVGWKVMAITVQNGDQDLTLLVAEVSGATSTIRDKTGFKNWTTANKNHRCEPFKKTKQFNGITT